MVDMLDDKIIDVERKINKMSWNKATRQKENVTESKRKMKERSKKPNRYPYDRTANYLPIIPSPCLH